MALPLVLLLTAVVGATMMASILSLSGLRRETAQARREAEFERLALIAEARFQFLALTEPFGSDGLYVGGARDEAGGRFPGYALPTLGDGGKILAIDERPYRWREAGQSADYRVTVQDEAGLVNLYQADVAMLTRLFSTAGLNDTDATNLANELIAYNAEPELHRPMRRASEIYRLENAPSLLTDRIWRNLSESIVAYPETRAININTASAAVLKIWFDLSDDQAQSIVDNRRQQSNTPGSNVLTAPEQIGAAPNGATSYAFSSGRLRFRFADPATGDVYQSSLVLTPANMERPVWIENARIRHPKPQSGQTDDIDDFPEIPGLAS